MMPQLKLESGGILALYYESKNKQEQMIAILILFFVLALWAWIYSKSNNEY